VVELAAEHAAKFQAFDLLFETVELRGELVRRCGVVFLDGKLQEASSVRQPCGQFAEGSHHAVQFRALAAECLRALGIIPDTRFFQLALDFGQAFRLAVIVKDTSSTR
jgi:hypothetical protein